MKQGLRLQVTDRRDFILGAGAVAALGVLFHGLPVAAQERPANLDEALKKIMGDAKPSDGKITLDLPEIAENGNTVPFQFSVDSPMTEADHVKAIYVFATGNPQVDVASFYFSPASGKASVASRMRLAKTQDVLGLAELSDGRFLMGKRTVKVTIGGCGG
jgi:sulfur-oxidizing protein SoxY